MIVVTPEQMKFLEAEADRNGNSYEDLMEKAGTGLSEQIIDMLSYPQKNILFLCGNGNNAGDCFVAARMLEDKAVTCIIALLCGEPKTEISLLNFNRLNKAEVITEHAEVISLLQSDEIDLVIDGVFGTGFHGELPENVREIFSMCEGKKILAVDVPSGGNCKTGTVADGTLKADVTITFAFKKFGMTQYPLKSYCGKTFVTDIGIPQKYSDGFDYVINVTDLEEVKSIIPERKPDSHKGDYGRLLTVCGSETMPGACIMALEAAIRCGVGLVQAAVPRSLMPVIAARIPEVMLLPLETDDDGFITFANFEKIMQASEKATAVLIGCGLGVTEQTKNLVKNLITNINCPIILDADGINCIAGCIDIIKQSKSDIIVTPHPAEMGRLCGKITAEIQSDRLSAALELTKEYENLTVVLKGAGTLTANQKRVNVEITGRPGLAKGGSGDVLAGIISSLTARGISCFDSALTGVCIHGLAGGRASSELTNESMTATDISKYLSEVFKMISDFKNIGMYKADQ